MKQCLLFCVLFAACLSSRADVYTNSASADAFVRAAAPTNNYGGAGADSVSGTAATNVFGTANGAFDTFIRFNTLAMVTNFNALFGSNSWAITGASLQVTEQSAPNNNIFNRGKGSFEVRWIANDAWTEGTGSPQTPSLNGINYNSESTLLNGATDVSLGTYTNAGKDIAQSFSLALPDVFVGDMKAGGEVGLFMTAADPAIGFTFSSRTFLPALADPYLIVSVVPKPGIASVTIAGPDLNLSCTNGAAGSTYSLLTSADITAPLSQWTSVASNTLSASGAFSMSASNALPSGATNQFFIIQMR